MARETTSYKADSNWQPELSLQKSKVSLTNACLLFFISLIGVRLLTMWFIPLTDTTEARYGEIARKMVETGDWITPWYDYGVPFWAKPPLSTWLAAFSLKIFGINEFAVRLPSLFLALGVLGLNWQFTSCHLNKSAQWLSTIILSSMALFYIASGAVMTDMTLLFACTLTLVAFWFAVVDADKKWGFIFFAGLGIGMLAKGPAAVVLSLLPIFCWLIWSNSWLKMWKALPWLGGIALMLMVFMPWYVIAEIKTPGFIEYFIVGEHFNRFLVAGWQGDLYGNAHYEKSGTIWLFLLIDALPWLIVPVVTYFISRYKKQSLMQLSKILQPNTTKKSLSNEQKYLWCWFLAPPVFFSLAHNILPTYVLTALPALAILISQGIKPVAIDEQNKIRVWVFLTGLFSPLIILLVMFVSLLQPYAGKKSARAISQLYHSIQIPLAPPLAYVGRRLYSMEFYNSGKAKSFKSIDLALANHSSDKSFYLALTNSQVSSLDANQKLRLRQKGSTDRYRLFIVGNGINTEVKKGVNDEL